MKNKLLLVAALLGCSLTGFSQTSDSVSYKNQFGIIASPSLQYLFQNKELPVGLIYKRQVKPDQAFRFTFNGWYQEQKYPVIIFGNNTTYLQKFTNYFSTALIGYEWQRELSKRWSFYYGADAGAGYGKSNSTFDFSDYNTGQIYSFSNQHTNSSTVSFILQPLAGIRFNVNSRLYIATETRIEISHTQRKYKNFETSYSSDQSPTTKELNNATFSSTNISYSPLSNIQLVFQF